MKERQIPFKAPMVRALLDGSKTQTRRVVKMKQSGWCKEIKGDCWHPNEISEWRLQDGRWFGLMGWYTLAFSDCPYGQIGDRLWVREHWRAREKFNDVAPRDIFVGSSVRYEADGYQRLGEIFKKALDEPWGKFRPGMFMPRWASRILLEITSVRVERLQDISEADAKAEGCEPGLIHINKCHGWTPYVLGYSILWDEINGGIGQNSWRSNPWVWVIEFKVVQA